MFYTLISIASSAGILAGLELGNIPIVPAMTLGIAAGIISIFTQGRLLRLMYILLAASLFFIGRSASFRPTDIDASHHYKQSSSFSGVIVNNPQTQKGTLSIIIDHVVDNTSNQALRGKVQASVAPYSDLQYGDEVVLTGNLQPVNLHNPDSYQRYLYFHQIFGTLTRPNLVIKARDNGNPLLAATYNLQRSIQQSIIRVLPKDEAGLLLGIVLGLQQPLSNEFSHALNSTSTTHIIVASGYNATIIIGTFMRLAGKLRRSTTITLALAALLIYVALSGFNPSIIRAAVMAVISLSARAVGRQRDGMRLLVLTALTMLIINPWWIFDISFQMSFAATAGIILIGEKVNAIFSRLPGVIGESTSTTIAAQLLTLPIISFNFGTIALLGLVANLLVLWIVPWIMAVGAVSVLAIWLLPLLGMAFALLVEPLLWYAKQVILWSTTLPAASARIQMTGIAVTCYYVVLVIIIWRGQYVPTD